MADKNNLDNSKEIVEEKINNAEDNENTDLDIKSDDIDDKEHIVVNTSPLVGWIFDVAHSMILAVVLIVILLTFFFRIVNVDGRSMMNTLLDSDKVIVTNFLYTPKNEDIIVISHGAEYDKPIIKRVIATENQTLKIDFENQRIYVDGTLIDEPYVSSELKEGNTNIPSVVPEGKVFVMGDNRLESLDSRYSEIGLIDEDDIIGKAQFVIFPFTRIQYLYNN
ncbi:MAG: signal peptidase I [Oscillospiraceae bacterium]|nr:signal peptidase I [Oscillospiraceae bacterium]